MIELIDTHSPKAIGVKIRGKIEGPDIGKVIKEVEAKLSQGEKLRVYVELESFGGISPDALIEDLKFVLPHLKDFERKAVVSDHEWMGKLVEIGDKFFPGLEVKHFSTEEKEKAMEWVTA